MRYVLEGVWSGYTSNQSRPVHRSVVTEKAAKTWEKLTGVLFTDGTYLRISVRPARPRENVEIILGYSELLSEAFGTAGTYDIASKL